MTNNKKAWTEPELIVLMRGNPEESVLTLCKSWNPTVGSDTVFSACYSVINPCSPQCDYQASS